MPKISQTTKRLALAMLVSGMKKRLPRDETYWMNGKAYSHAELVAFFQAEIDALDAVRSARGALAAAIATERATSRRVTARLLPLRDALIQRFPLDALADFGLRARKKPGPKLIAAKAAGVAKARATREARRTREAPAQEARRKR